MLTALSALKCKVRESWQPRRALFSRLKSDTSSAHSAKIQSILNLSLQFQNDSDVSLLSRSRELRSQALLGTTLSSLLTKGFALVRESARRAHGLSHYEVQLMAGIELFDGKVVEMQTGEGKTLAALLPVYLHALLGRGVHVVTANDYLAQRDAEFSGAVFDRLGISVGCLDESVPRENRQTIYQRDVTYGTSREFGFDYLKDRLAITESAEGSESKFGSVVQRGHSFALIDEADSVLIDDARTPLLIAGRREPNQWKQQLAARCDEIATQISHPTEFDLKRDLRQATLTESGCRVALRSCSSELIHHFGPTEIYRYLENAITANYLFQKDCHYVIVDSEVQIVDESTGRIADGRQWQNGLQQAIEAKEQVEISGGTGTLAKITVQSYFRMYRQLAGLTGTAEPVAHEFKKVFERSVAVIPTRLPSQRRIDPPRMFCRYAEKLLAVAAETKRRMAIGQAVLIGTPSVEASVQVSNELHRQNIEHQVLNCVAHEKESAIIAQAGQPGRVTVATNMAGRGTDIEVHPSVLAVGGLHIIGTELHSSLRIDRQLIGRAARQGQPGSCQFFLSLEDELLTQSGGTGRAVRNNQASGELPSKWLKVFQGAQQKIEKLYTKQRFDLLEHEKQRTKLCRQVGLDDCLEMIDGD